MTDSAVRVVFLGDSASAKRAVKDLEGSYHSLGRTAARVAATLGLGLLVRDIGRATLDFDKGMRNVNSLARLSEKQFASLEKQVLALGKQTAQGPKTLAGGLYDIVSSGFEAADGLKILKTSAIAATAGLTDTATSTKAIVAILNAYNLDASKARNVSSMLFKEVQLGVNTFGELASYIGDTAPMAAALKIPFSDVAAALALITLHGTNMSEASTQVGRVMADLMRPSESLAAQLKKMGFESGQAAVEQLGFIGVIQKLDEAAKGSTATTADWFQNIRSLRGMLNLTGPNLEKFNRFAEQIGASYRKGGEDVKAFNEQSKSISVQWAKAKASLTSAAIPLATVLFPALSTAAGGVEHLASRIEQNLPMIQAQFGGVANAAFGAGSAVAEFAFTTEGMAVIVGTVAAMSTARLAAGIASLVASLGAAAGPVGILTAGVGLLAGGLFYMYQQSQTAGTGMTMLQQQIAGVADAARAAQAAVRGLATAKLNAKAATLAVEVAEKSYADAVKRSGKGSDEAKQAHLGLEQARLGLKQATAAETDAEERAAEAKRNSANAAANLRKKYDGIIAAAKRTEPALNSVGSWFKTTGSLTQNYISIMQDLAGSMGKGDTAARKFADAAIDLSIALGRIPTYKEINLYMKTHVSPGADNSVGPVGGRKRDRGGFIPGATGQAVPILAHAGEAILNPAQVQVLGGARALSQMFGWSGDQSAFAKGGVVGGLKRSVKRPPKNRPPRTLKQKVSTARWALKAWEAIDQRETDSDREYGQLAREYDISQETFLVTDAEGNETLDTTAVETRLTELDNLIGKRNEMLGLLDEEREALKKALAELAAAIARLKKAIAKEKKAAKDDRAEAAKITKKINAERAKKKPNQKTINKLESEAEQLRSRATRHDDAARGFESDVRDFTTSRADVQKTLGHILPGDIRDVTLDVSSLEAEKKQIRAIAPSASTSTGAAPPTGGGENTDDLLRRIAQLQQALTIQGSQLGIIGAFQKGALYVPETGLALVHAGERITPAGRGAMSVRDSEPAVVYLTLSGGISEQQIEAKIAGATDRVKVVIGTEADRLRREGR